MAVPELYLDHDSDRSQPLLAVGTSLYRHPGEPLATMALVRRAGRWTLHGEFGSYYAEFEDGTSRRGLRAYFC